MGRSVWAKFGEIGCEHPVRFLRVEVRGGILGKLLHGEITQEILGAAFAVHNALGPGCQKSIYEEAIAHELGLRGMQVGRQVEVPIMYKTTRVGTHLLDLVVNDKVVVELTAITETAPLHKGVVLSYLAATRLPVAMLINFGASVTFNRIVRSA